MVFGGGQKVGLIQEASVGAELYLVGTMEDLGGGFGGSFRCSVGDLGFGQGFQGQQARSDRPYRAGDPSIGGRYE